MGKLCNVLFAEDVTVSCVVKRLVKAVLTRPIEAEPMLNLQNVDCVQHVIPCLLATGQNNICISDRIVVESEFCNIHLVTRYYVLNALCMS